MKRKCGTCTLCCTALAVPELDKPNGVSCQHLTSEGCGIYEDRPESCRRFECGWLAGMGDLSVRPDRVGAVLHVEDGDLGPDGLALMLYTKIGDDSYKRSRYISRLASKAVERGRGVVVISGEDRTFSSRPDSPFARVTRGATDGE